MAASIRETLKESERFVLGHAWETVFVLDKRTGRRTYAGDHYGDPTCGIIAPDQTWFVTGGCGVTYFDFARGLREFLRGEKDLFVHAMKLHGREAIRILVDPWSEEAAVWELHVPTLRVRKLRDGPFIREESYDPLREVPF